MQPQLVAQPLPQRLEARQCVGLPISAIERQHELRPQRLAERLGGTQLLQLPDQLRVPAQGQVRRDASLQRQLPILVQAHCGGAGERLVEVRQRRPAPQGQGGAEHVCGISDLGPRQVSTTQRRERLEAADIQLIGPDPQEVAGLPRLQPIAAAKGAPHLRDIGLQRRGGARGRTPGPQLVGQAVRPHDGVGVQGQERQQRPRLAGRQREHPRPFRDLQGAEQPELHRPPAFAGSGTRS